VHSRRFTRQQRTPIVMAVLCIVITIVVMQLWLFTATMDAYLRGDSSILVPAALASLVCLALNVGLLVHLRRLDA
jgi:divalent metal cation (Fe/Co/Zn/Cd) transporter